MKKLVVFLWSGLAWAGLWPDTFGSYHRVTAAPVVLADRPIWQECGFQQGETARYESGGEKFTASAWRLQDPTGALAAFQWQRPADSRPTPLAKLGVETAKGVLLVHGNYLLSFEGYRPQVAEVAGVLENLPDLDNSPLPVLPGYLPAADLMTNSERYVLGPASLARFDPGIPPSTAAFHLGAEAEVASYQVSGGELKLAVFNYPTPQIAMERIEGFQKLAGAMVKRSGPLVAVVLAPSSADAAERLLSLIRYQASVTMSERVPTRRDNIGDLVINAFILIGLLLAFFVVAGLTVGGLRAYLRRGKAGEEEGMILLHLEDH